MPTLGEIQRGRDIGRRERCKFIWTGCIDCGKERWVRYKVQKAKPITSLCHHCSCKKATQYRRAKRYENQPSWKERQYKNGQGYILVSLPSSNFFYPMADKKGYVMEHRLVMAKRLGRCLQPWEIVHHQNRKRDDNQDENLYLAMDAGHNQITRMETILKHQQLEIEELQQRITLLEAENSLLKAQPV